LQGEKGRGRYSERGWRRAKKEGGKGGEGEVTIRNKDLKFILQGGRGKEKGG